MQSPWTQISSGCLYFSCRAGRLKRGEVNHTIRKSELSFEIPVILSVFLYKFPFCILSLYIPWAVEQGWQRDFIVRASFNQLVVVSQSMWRGRIFRTNQGFSMSKYCDQLAKSSAVMEEKYDAGDPGNLHSHSGVIVSLLMVYEWPETIISFINLCILRSFSVVVLHCLLPSHHQK